MGNYCFTVPILPGEIELVRKWNQENIVDNKEHDEVFKIAGISREQVGFNICRKEILLWQAMKRMILKNHSKRWRLRISHGLLSFVTT